MPQTASRSTAKPTAQAAGPWTPHLTGGIHPKFRGPLAVVDGPMGERIAEVPADPGQDPMPRARLIAAAADLLAALENLLLAINCRERREIDEAEALARTAIAKATGGA